MMPMIFNLSFLTKVTLEIRIEKDVTLIQLASSLILFPLRETLLLMSILVLIAKHLITRNYQLTVINLVTVIQ